MHPVQAQRFHPENTRSRSQARWSYSPVNSPQSTWNWWNWRQSDSARQTALAPPTRSSRHSALLPCPPRAVPPRVALRAPQQTPVAPAKKSPSAPHRETRCRDWTSRPQSLNRPPLPHSSPRLRHRCRSLAPKPAGSSPKVSSPLAPCCLPPPHKSTGHRGKIPPRSDLSSNKSPADSSLHPANATVPFHSRQTPLQTGCHLHSPPQAKYSHHPASADPRQPFRSHQTPPLPRSRRSLPQKQDSDSANAPALPPRSEKPPAPPKSNP